MPQIQTGQNLSTIVQQAGITPQQFLQLNPQFAATGRPNDWRGLTGFVRPGQTYNLAPTAPAVAPPAPAGGIVAPTGGPGIVSSTPALNDLNNFGNQLDQMINQPDPMLEYLQKQQMTLQERIAAGGVPGVEEKGIQVAAGRLQQKTESDFAAYKAGLETLGIQSGLSRYAPGLQADRMINAANQETQKLADIQDKEDLAMARAKQARIEKDAGTLKSVMSEIRQLKQDKRQAAMDVQNKRTQDITVAKSLATGLLDSLQGLDPSEYETRILQTAQENNLNPATLIAAMANADKILSPTEAATLGVPYGTTRSQAGARGIIPARYKEGVVGGDNPLSTIELQRIEDLYGVTIPYGTTRSQALKLLGEEEQETPGTSKINEEFLKDKYSTNQLFKLARSFGIERKINLSRKDEVKRYFEEKFVSQISEAKRTGWTDEEIEKFLQGKMK